MLERAEQYDWDGVMERDALRVEQLRRLPEADLDSEGMGSQRAAARLRQALEVGRQVRELMEQERDRLGQASRMDQRRREAGAAYHQVSKAVDRGEDSGGSAR
nr:flagellar protein FliT [Halorhodospira abdelmalekii]